MMRFPLVFGLLLVLASGAVARDWVVEESLGSDALSWEVAAEGWVLRIPGGHFGEGTGAPDLPGLLIRVPLPEGERLSDWSGHFSEPLSLGGDRLPRNLDPLLDENGRAFEDAGLPPGQLLLLGQPARRGLREAHFYWRPLEIRDGRLLLSERLSIHLSSEPDPDPPLAVLRSERAAAGGPFAPRQRPGLEGSPVDAVILTTEAMAASFQELADWHIELGTRTVVRTIEWVKDHYLPGADDAETLRFFIQEAYQLWGLKVVIIGGDTGDIPVRYMRSRAGALDRLVPNDLYYSCLDGNWNADGDAYWAELPYSFEGHPDYDPGDDLTDLLPELWVGRITVSSSVDAEAVIDKIIAYREGEAAGFQDEILFLAEVLFPKDWEQGEFYSRDGAEYATEIIDDYLAVDMDYTCLFQNYLDPLWVAYSPTQLTVETALEAMNSGEFAIVDHNGHGAPHDMSVGDGNINVNHVGQLVNANPFLITLMNCSSTAFDSNCLAEAYFGLHTGGAVAVFGTSRESYPQYSEIYYDGFYDRLWDGGLTQPGEIFDSMRQEYAALAYGQSYSRWTYFIVTLLGDPLVDLWSGDARTFTVDAPDQLDVGAGVLDLSVSDSRGAADNVQVTLYKENEVWASGLTDVAGQLSLSVQPLTAGSLQLSVRGSNGVIYREQITVVGEAGPFVYLESWQIDDDAALDPANDGDGLAEAGELLRLELSVRNGGGAGATGLAADLTQDHDSLAVVTAHEDYGSLAAGALALLDALEIRPAPGLADGALATVLLTLGADGIAGLVDTLRLSVAAPDPVLTDWELADEIAAGGDGDGTIEPDEHFYARPRLLNRGLGQTGALTLELEAIDAGVTVIDGVVNLGSLEELETGRPDPGFIVSLDDPSVETLARLVVTDALGRTWVDTLDFLPPGAPTGLAAGFSEDPNAINLRWDANTEEDMAGYHIYIALGEGAFSRHSLQPVEHATFTVGGLPSMMTVRAQVTAVDSGGLESEAGEVLLTATNPAQISGFPGRFEQGSTSAPAVGNISPRGGLEVIAASDYVYAWNWTGEEVRDGDNNSTTMGIFSMEAADIVGSVTILPLFDDEGCDQIVVASRGDNPSGFCGVHVLDRNGNEMPGWPRETSHWVWGNVAGGDLDGDGDLELVALDLNGRLYAFHHDGSEVFDGDDDPATIGVLMDGIGSWPMCSPALADMDGDGDDEIIFTGGVNHGYLHVLSEDGIDLPGFPVSPHGGFRGRGPIALAHLDGDRTSAPEILVLSENDFLYAYTSAGTHFTGFPLPFEINNPYAVGPGVIPIDINDDDVPELVVAQNISDMECRVSLIDVAGNCLPGWPIILETQSQASPVVGDLDGDGVLEIVFGGDAGVIYGWNVDGSVQNGFPIPTGDFVRATPLLADLDQDGDVELIACSQDRNLYVWDFTGAFSEAAFPWPTQSANYRRTGLFGDWDDVPVLLAGLDIEVGFEAVRLRWLSEDPRVSGWSLRREMRMDAGYWGSPEWVFQGESFLAGEVDWLDDGLEPGATYRYTAYAAIAGEGEQSLALGEVTLPTPVWADRLRGAWPNPFNPTTTLAFELSVDGPARLEVFSVEGRRLRVLVDEVLTAGRHERVWDGRDEDGRAMGSGVYLVRFVRPGLSQSRRVVLLK